MRLRVLNCWDKRRDKLGKAKSLHLATRLTLGPSESKIYIMVYATDGSIKNEVVGLVTTTG